MNKASGLLLHNHADFSIWFKIIDGILVIAALWFVLKMRGYMWNIIYILPGLVFVLIAHTSTLYNNFHIALSKEWIRPLVTSWMFTVFSLLLIGYAAQVLEGYTRLGIAIWIICTPGLLALWRVLFQSIMRHLRTHGYNTRSAAIVGDTDKGRDLAMLIQNSPEYGLKLVRHFGAKTNGDDFKELIEDARTARIELVYVALPMHLDRTIKDLIEKLSDTTVSVYLIPDVFYTSMMTSKWTSIGNVPLLSVFESPITGNNGWVKRSEDFVIALLLLAIFAFPMMLIALFIKIGSPGPILFAQTRYGLSGKKIRVLKFRTMTVVEPGEETVQATKNDARITPIGKFLRRYSLDELPQLLNVLSGDMSLVGPRPHPVNLNEEYRNLVGGYMLRHMVKPGMTGWAQINGLRGETSTVDKMEKRVEFDLWYVRNWSLWLDIWILIVTTFKVFSDENAY